MKNNECSDQMAEFRFKFFGVKACQQTQFYLVFSSIKNNIRWDGASHALNLPVTRKRKQNFYLCVSEISLFNRAMTTAI